MINDIPLQVLFLEQSGCGTKKRKMRKSKVEESIWMCFATFFEAVVVVDTVGMTQQLSN